MAGQSSQASGGHVLTALRQSTATFDHGTLSKVGFILLVYLDLLLTLFAVSHGFNEMNPVMSRFLDRSSELLLVKGVAPVFVAWLVPSRLLWPSIGLMLAVAGWNIAQLLTSL